MADATRLKVEPRRRSITTFPVNEDLAGLGVETWPLVWSDPHSVYFRPGFDGLMVCAMDETPSPPCDAVCDERFWEMGATYYCGKGQPMQSAPCSHGASPARFRQINILNTRREI